MLNSDLASSYFPFNTPTVTVTEKFAAQRKLWILEEKFGINCSSAEAQFGTGRGITLKNQILPLTQFTQIFVDLPRRLFVSKQGVRFNLATLDSIRKLFRPTSSRETPTKKYISFIF